MSLISALPEVVPGTHQVCSLLSIHCVMLGGSGQGGQHVVCAFPLHRSLQLRGGSNAVPIGDTNNSKDEESFTKLIPLRKARAFQKPSISASLPDWVMWPLLQGILGKQVLSLELTNCKAFGESEYFLSENMAVASLKGSWEHH